MGRAHHEVGDYPVATAAAHEALEIFQALGQLANAANASVELCRIRYTPGDYEGALELAEDILALFREARVPQGIAYGLWDAGRRLALGDTAAAIALPTEALAAFEQIGNHLGIADTCHDLGRAQHAAGDAREAAGLLGGTKAEGGA